MNNLLPRLKEVSLSLAPGPMPEKHLEESQPGRMPETQNPDKKRKKSLRFPKFKVPKFKFPKFKFKPQVFPNLNLIKFGLP